MRRWLPLPKFAAIGLHKQAELPKCSALRPINQDAIVQMIGQHPTSNGLDPGIQALSACLQFNSSLVSLGLSYSGLRAPGVCALCKGVAANGTLTALDLNNAWGAKDAMECFAEVGELLREARGASRLQHLSVGGNYGGDEGMALLLHARR